MNVLHLTMLFGLSIDGHAHASLYSDLPLTLPLPSSFLAPAVHLRWPFAVLGPSRASAPWTWRGVSEGAVWGPARSGRFQKNPVGQVEKILNKSKTRATSSRTLFGWSMLRYGDPFVHYVYDACDENHAKDHEKTE